MARRNPTRLAAPPDRRSARPVVERLRTLCLALPETTERDSWGHPNFRAGARTFAVFEIIKGRPSMAFRLPPADVGRLLQRKAFFDTPYGRGQWVSLWVDEGVDWKMVDDLVRRSYRTVALKRMLKALESESAALLLRTRRL